MITFKELSKIAWGNKALQDNPTLEHIQTGSLQRIADACELMAYDNQKVKDELQRYKGYLENANARALKLEGQLKAQKGHNTRLKKYIKELEKKEQERKSAPQYP
jgi:hypothetical protein